MEIVIERCAGLDVHKDTVVACVRVPDPAAGRQQVIETFATTTAGPLALRDGPGAYRVRGVGREAPGVYWRRVSSALGEACRCQWVTPRHARQLPGRKTDVADAAWLCQLLEHGMVRPSFVPPKPIRE